MSTSQNTKARSHVGGLMVGLTASAGGSAKSPAWIHKIATYTGTVTPTSSILTQTVDVQTITCTGVKVGDGIMAIPPVAIEAGLTYSAFVSAANTVTLRLNNPTASTITTTARSWTFLHIALV